MGIRPEEQSDRVARRTVVVTAADEKYAISLAVMGRSLAESSRDGHRPILCVLDGGLRTRSRRRVMGSWDPSQLEVHWIVPPRAVLRGLPILECYGPSIYFRFIIPQVLPQHCRRAIYVDADALVLRDLWPLWRSSLDGLALGAVRDTGFLTLRSACFPCQELGLSPSSAYLSSGVLLMDLDRWRRERLSDKVTDAIRSCPHELSFPDQDGLNIVLADKWKQLDPCWNVVLDSAYRNLTKLAREERLRLARAIARPAILHFAAGPKPWEEGCRHRRLFLFHFYLDRTQWSGWRPD